MKLGIPGDTHTDGYNASISKGRVREVTEEDRWGLQAQGIGLFIAKEYTIKEGNVVIKSVELDKGIH